MTAHKLPLSTALLVNLNVMIGTGIFINTIPLAYHAGFLGFVSYGLVAFLMIPLIAGTALLLRHFPSGGFYTYAAATIHPFVGFLSSWSYFTGKLASVALLTHVCTVMLSNRIPGLTMFHPLLVDCIIIGLFTWLTIQHVRAGKTLMYTFMVCKILPIVFIIFSSLYLWNQWTAPSYFPWEGIPTTIPLVLFAFTGFEVCCSLSTSIENAAKNAPKALYISFALVVSLTILYQLLFYVAAGNALTHTAGYMDIFPMILSMFNNNPYFIYHVSSFLSIAIACAALGGSYGILFSNHWNLYALAQHGHVWGSSFLQKLNKHHVPSLCILIEASICIAYLFVTQAAVPILQQISALGCVIAYTCSMIGLIFLAYRQPIVFQRHYKMLGYSALCSCFLFIGICIKNLYVYGIHVLGLFGCILMLGIAMFFIRKK